MSGSKSALAFGNNELKTTSEKKQSTAAYPILEYLCLDLERMQMNGVSGRGPISLKAA